MEAAVTVLSKATEQVKCHVTNEVVLFDGTTLLKAAAFLTGISFLVLYLVKKMDPEAAPRREAQNKGMRLLRRLGIKNSLNRHEMQIAAGIVDPSELNFTWKDVAGLDDTIEQIKKTAICPILLSQQTNYSSLIQAPKGILLYGQPGVGKTLIAKALTKEANCTFINLDLSVLQDKWYGESEKLTYAVFSLAQKIQPCIIFIDEIDSLLRTRTSTDHDVTAKMKAQFMSLWDGLITDPKKIVIVLGATNRPADLDPAILRRMVCKFFIPVPGDLQRRRILELILRKEHLGPDVNLRKLVEMTDGFTGSDLKEVARSAAVASLANEFLLNPQNFPSSRYNNRRQAAEPEQSLLQRLNQAIKEPFVPRRRSVITRDARKVTTPDPETYVPGPILMKEFVSAIEAARTSKRNCRQPMVCEGTN